MRKIKLKIIVKMRKMDSFKDLNDVDYNDDEYEDIDKEREMAIGQEDDENEDRWGRCLKVKMRKRYIVLRTIMMLITMMISVKT